ncbi:amidase domain-containing protein [Streptosporangium saharense]|uniref:amidase domain-containing protein n=1 Tax=Streptosporangium saharense TaxID=1706840 RepID=UPI003693EAB9
MHSSRLSGIRILTVLCLVAALLTTGQATSAAAAQPPPELITNGPYPSDDSASRSSTPTLSVYAPARPNRPVPKVDFEVWDADQTTRLSGGPGTRTSSGRVTWTVPGAVLTDGAEYNWRTRVTDGGVAGEWSEFHRLAVDGTDGEDLPAEPPTPRAVEGLTATPAVGGAYLTWQPAEPGTAAYVTTYVVEALPANGAGPAVAQVVVPGTQAYAVVTGLADAEHVYTITALNDWHAGPAAQSPAVRPAQAVQSPEHFARIADEYLAAQGKLLTGAAETPQEAAEASPQREAIRDVVLADGPAAVGERQDQGKAKLRYTAYSSQLSDLAVLPSADGRSVTVHATVSENLDQAAELKDGQTEQASEERANRFTFSFTAAPASLRRSGSGGFTLTSVDTDVEAPVDDVPATNLTDDDGPPPEPVLRDENGFVEGPPLPQTKAVNSSAIAWYAWKYWRYPNKHYKIRGNDCTNFVSQAMRYGGLKKRTGWYKSDSSWWYTGLWPNYGSWTWYNAHRSANHLSKKRRAVFRRYFNQAVKGDILYFDLNGNGSIDHAAVVNGVSGNHIWYAQHTRSAWNVHLNARLHLYPKLRLYIAHVTG